MMLTGSKDCGIGTRTSDGATTSSSRSWGQFKPSSLPVVVIIILLFTVGSNNPNPWFCYRRRSWIPGHFLLQPKFSSISKNSWFSQVRLSLKSIDVCTIEGWSLKLNLGISAEIQICECLHDWLQIGGDNRATGAILAATWEVTQLGLLCHAMCHLWCVIRSCRDMRLLRCLIDDG